MPSPRTDMIVNGNVMRTRRKALGYTQFTLAVASAASARTIAMIERNQRIDPPTSVTLRIAKALSITVEALCAGSRPYEASTTRQSPYNMNLDPASGE